MTGDALVIILRLAFVLLLYGFLFNLLMALRRDLGAARHDAVSVEPARPVSAPPLRLQPVEGRLLVLDSGNSDLRSGRAFRLVGETIIGRAPDVDLRIEDRMVSGQHARLYPVDGRWLLEDLGSTNGTLLNQQPVAREQQVEYGDVIGIGSVTLKLAR